MKHVFVFAVLALISLGAQGEGSEETKSQRTRSLREFFDNGGLSKDGEMVVFHHDNIDFISESDWDKTPSEVLDIDKVKVIGIFGGDVTAKIIRFFSSCRNVEEIQIGGAGRRCFFIS